MGAVATHIIDSSAMSRTREQEVGAVIGSLIDLGRVATCAVLDFEALYTARSPSEYVAIGELRRGAFEYLPVNDAEWSRALEVQAVLASQSRLREVGMADLLIAAVAERHGLTLLHYDGDFDTIAEITGQDARWVVPRGQTP
ncbi:PIN domain nuclease [Parafrigoribacterium humi]|uniref:PIN domain nuclease n=1 Tax=Parafrigoribacterium humi TaxID=3144664 RepID=UPI0032ECAC72